MILHDLFQTQDQKNLSVPKILVRNSGAGNGCTNFVGAWEKSVLSAEKKPCP